MSQPLVASGCLPPTQRHVQSALMNGAEAARLWLRRWYAFASSHGGDVVCVEGASGRLIWRALLSGRANIGLALTAGLQARACMLHACFVAPAAQVLCAQLLAPPWCYQQGRVFDEQLAYAWGSLVPGMQHGRFMARRVSRLTCYMACPACGGGPGCWPAVLPMDALRRLSRRLR